MPNTQSPVIKTPTPIQQLHDPLFKEKKIEVWMKRDDLTDPEIMGNKWRKLKYNLQKAKDENYNGIVSYGGAYSNHIAALAAAGRIFNIKTIGVIRGDELNMNSNPTLQKAAKDGMELHFVSRFAYREMKESLTLPFHSDKKLLILPEGGSNELALKGAREIVDEIQEDEFDILALPVGSGGTLAGIASALSDNVALWGFYALKGDWIHAYTDNLFQEYEIKRVNYKLFDDQVFGGFSRVNADLLQFILDFRQNFRILLDPVYTGKMLFSVGEMIKNDQIAIGMRILLLHTGGLQGWEGIKHRYQWALPTQ